MNPAREQRLVFGEIAQQYDTYWPSYPHALFDTIMEFGALRARDRALEIGAGTGKGTTGFLARGLAVHALEPSEEMATILRAKGVDVEQSLFETWDPGADAGAFDLVYGAQSWHWVQGDDRYDRLAAALRPGGTVALFWNKGREWTGALGADNDAVYAEHAPHLSGGSQWDLTWVKQGLDACAAFGATEIRTVTWTCGYTTAEWVQLLGTHSDHRILPEAQRERLHAAVGAVVDRHGGTVEAIYDVVCFLSRRV